MVFVDFVMFCFKQKTAYEMLISDWRSDVCSSDLGRVEKRARPGPAFGFHHLGPVRRPVGGEWAVVAILRHLAADRQHRDDSADLSRGIPHPDRKRVV